MWWTEIKILGGDRMIKKETSLNLRISETLKERLEKASTEAGMSMSDYVRYLIMRYAGNEK
jgi:antitoxin component of RelBE/YafQ-DinJ toxin-antitoxin module